ncbi:radical SAM/SPASM domain-containing protein [Humidesulfovibrio sp.]
MIRNTPLLGLEAENYVAGRHGFALDDLLDFPKFINIETVYGCNARCVMCGIDFGTQKRIIMDDALFEKIITEIGEHSHQVQKVMFYMRGEPLLDPKLAQRIKRAKDLGIKTTNIATNASLLTATKARGLIEAGLDEIYIALDSMKPDVYAEIRRGLKFATVLKNIHSLIDLRNELNPAMRIRLQIIQQEINKDEPKPFTAYWRERLAATDQVAVQQAHNWASKIDGGTRQDDSQINNIPCVAIWSTMPIFVNGDAPLCCMDTQAELSLGNLTEKTIEEIWLGQRPKHYRKLHTTGRRTQIALCDGCTVWRDDKRELISAQEAGKDSQS